jgi:diacylglycerol kinase (ATP)
MKNKFGHAAYVAEGIKRLSKITGQQMRVEHDGEVVEGSFILGLISNTISVGGMKKLIASGVCFDDGLFEVVLVKTPKNAIELSNTINEAVLNKLNDKHFVTFKTSKVTFTSVNEVPWTLDGESGGKHTYVEIENCKQAIRFKLKPNDITAEQTAVQCSAGDMIMTDDGHPVVIEDQSEIED